MPKSQKIYQEVVQNGIVCDNPQSTENGFRNCFANLNNVRTDIFNNEMKHCSDNAYEEILAMCNTTDRDLQVGLIDYHEVFDRIKALKRKKAGGHDKIQNEYLLFGGNILIRTLMSLFTMIVKQGFVPGEFLDTAVQRRQ